MSFEVQCGSCHERFTPEQDSGIVACPHCQTKVLLPGHLPAESAPTDAQPSATGAEPGASGPTSGNASLSDSHASVKPDSAVLFPGLPGDGGPPSDVAVPVFEEADAPPGTSDISPSAVLRGFADADPSPLEEASDLTGTAIPPTETDFRQRSEDAAQRSEVGVQTSEVADQRPETSHPSPLATHDAHETERGVSRFLFMLLVGYAAAVTVILIWLLFWHRGNQLENLPDVDPNPQGYIVPENAPMPVGHTLEFGETGRFGSLEITPLKVTRGPAEEVVPGVGETVETGPVLKLWLRIRNVSDDQTFRPFGRELLLMQGKSKQREQPGANIFVCRVEEKRADGHRVFVFQQKDSYFVELRGQQIDRTLGPHEEYTTFLATTEQGIDELSGPLVWRVHFRKGYNPKTKHGVTTLIEVPFDSDVIHVETTDDASR